MLRLGLIIHTDVFRLQENPGEIRRKEPATKADRRYGAICWDTAPIGTHNWFLRRKQHRSATNGRLNLAVHGGEFRDFTSTLKDTQQSEWR